MTSISSSASPLPFVQRAVQRDVAAGSVSATDQTALTAAIGDIATQLQAGATGAAGSATTTAATTAPKSMKDRVDGLIDDQVSSGKLTASQGGELKTAFAQAHAHMHGAHGHHGGGGGALDGLLASLTGSSSTDPATGTAIDPVTGLPTGTATGSTDPATGASSSGAGSAATAIAALGAFVTQFKAALGTNATYGANGQSSASPLSVLVSSIG